MNVKDITLPSAWHFFATDNEGRKAYALYERVTGIEMPYAVIEVARRAIGNGGEPEGDYKTVRTYRKHIGGMIPHEEFTPEMRARCRREEGRSFYQFGKKPILSDEITKPSGRGAGASAIDGERDEED